MTHNVGQAITAGVQLVGTAVQIFGNASSKWKFQRVLYQARCNVLFLVAKRNIKEGVNLLWQLFENECSEDVHINKLVLENGIRAIAELSATHFRRDFPERLWLTLPPLLKALKSLPAHHDPTIIEDAKKKFDEATEICEYIGHVRADSKFQRPYKIAGIALAVISTLIQHTRHPSFALETCKGYLEAVEEVKLTHFQLQIHVLLWHFAKIHNEPVLAKADWPRGTFKKKLIHPVLHCSCYSGSMCVLRGDTPADGTEHLHEPRDITVDSRGNIIIVDGGEEPWGQVKVFSKSGKFLFPIEYTPPEGESFGGFSPMAVAVDTRDNIYVCSSTASVGPASKQILVFDQDGKQLCAHGKESLHQGFRFGSGGLAVNSLGQMVVADVARQRVCVLSLDGTSSELRNCDRVLTRWGTIFLCTTNDDEVVAVSKDQGGSYSICVYQREGVHLRHTEVAAEHAGLVGAVVTGVTYQPLTNHVILAVRKAATHCNIGRNNQARWLFYAVDTLEFINCCTLWDKYISGCIGAVPGHFSIVRVPARGPMCLYKSLCDP